MVFGGWRRVYVLLMGLVGRQGEQRSVQEGSCTAVGLRGVTVRCTFGDRVTVQSDAWRCVRRGSGNRALSHGAGVASPLGAKGGHLVLTLWCAAATPHGTAGPAPLPCPPAQHCQISPGARSRCADALVPALDSQLPALVDAFLEQLREGQRSQDCLTPTVNVTLPGGLLPVRSRLWVHCHQTQQMKKPSLGQRCLRRVQC